MYMITNIYMITAIAVIGGALFGFDISSQSAIIGTAQYKRQFGATEAGPTSSQQGGITAAMPGGSFVGSLCSGYLSDKFGRKKTIMVGSVIWMIGSALCAASHNIALLVVGRFINGIAIGLCSAQVPVYITELAPPRIRGRVVGLQQWAITWGILIMFYVSYGCSFIDGTASFRIPWGLQAVPGILLFIGLLFLPESPRWLARKDRWEECLHVLAMVHGKGDEHNPVVVAEYTEIKEMVTFERENSSVSWVELFHKNMLTRTIIACFVQIWSQLTGMNVMMYYIVYVFGMAGKSGNANLVSSSIQYVINVIMTLPGLWALDHVGRRPLLIGGAICMGTWLFAVGGIMAAHGRPATPSPTRPPEESWEVSGPASNAVIACSYLFVASFACTWGPVSWVYPPEIFPLRVRSMGVALSTSCNWIFNFALGYFVPSSFENIAYKTYFIFAAFCMTMTIHVFLMFPETRQKALEEVEQIFLDKIPAWRTRGGTQIHGDNLKTQEEKMSTQSEITHEEAA